MKLKRKSKTVIATVFYQKSYTNLKKFVKSLNYQSDKDFDLLILNDGVVNFDTELLKNFNFKIFKTKNTINKNRIILIKYCKKMKYKNILLIDSDDCLDNKRVEISKKYLRKNDIVVNDLNIIIKNKLIIKNYFSKRIKNDFKFRSKELLNKNFLGLSNTSLKTIILKKVRLDRLIDAPIFDWALGYLLLKNNTGIFTNETTTNYNVDINSPTCLIRKKKLNKKIFEIKKKQLNFFKKKIGNSSKSIDTKIKQTNKYFFWWEVSNDRTN